MDDRLFHRRIFEAAEELIPAGAGVVCGVSGGVDSMVMLHALAKVSEIHGRNWKLSVAHLDHQLRAESSSDAEFVRLHAQRTGVPCLIETVDVSAEVLRTGKSIEAVARELRYAFFANAADQLGAGIIAVAHHAEDQAETVLLRMIRGTGLRGLAAMRPSRRLQRGGAARLVRPLLELRRCDILDYAARHRIDYREDSTNADHYAATRNFIRHRLIPEILESVNPRAIDALVRLACQARRADEAIRRVAASRGRRMLISREPGMIVIDADRLARQPEAVGGEIVRRVVATFGVAGELSFERIAAVLQLSASDGRLRRLELPGGVTIERRGRRLMFVIGQGAELEASPQVEDAAH
jgi:tRNA(Ile)-lysidine synthase